jgi:hypothetical protein
MKEQKFQIKEQRTKEEAKAEALLAQKSESDSFMMLAFLTQMILSAARWRFRIF